MSEITFLHLSDLHFRSSKRKDINIVLKALFEDLMQFRRQDIKPDFVIFSGDMIDAGDLGYSKSVNDYDEVFTVFVDPLLKLLELTTDFFFFCAGNHDIQRSKVDDLEGEIQEKGLQALLTDRDAVNKFIDGAEENSEMFPRLTNFEAFRNLFKSKFIHSTNCLRTTHHLTIADKKIGIACINSAWRAYGGEADKGKLIIGERVVDHCIEALTDCDLRIGVVHHPYSYLATFEETALQRRINANFNFWLHGHTHEPDAKVIQALDYNQVVDISGGALYYHRQWYNGYSLVNYSFDTKKGKVYIREYTERGSGRQFIPAEAYVGDGIFPFQLPELSTGALSDNRNLLVLLRGKTDDLISESVLARISESENKKGLLSVFVEPPLSTKPEAKPSVYRSSRKDTQKSKLSLGELLTSGENIVFVGKPETGKTTLLNYIYLMSLESNASKSPWLPVILEFRHLPRGRNRFKKAISRYFNEQEISFSSEDIEAALEAGNYIILVDSLDMDDRDSIAEFRDFTATYGNNRYICTVNDTLISAMAYDDLPPNLGMKYKRVYIHSFKKKANEISYRKVVSR